MSALRCLLFVSVLVGGLASCGGTNPGPDEQVHVSFVRQPLVCAQTGLAAKLQAQGIEDCVLEVSAQNTVQGTCAGFAPGQAHQLRLLYFTNLPAPAQPQVLELASSITLLDLTGFEGEETVISFDRVEYYPDDDGDGISNINEWCAGTNPRGP